MKRAISLPLTTLLALALTYPCAAQEVNEPTPWYQVEIILFDQEQKGHIGSENWPMENSRIDESDSYSLSIPPPPVEREESSTQPTETAVPPAPVEIPATPSTASAFTLLPADALLMGDIYARIQRNGGIKPLAHVGWVQPGLPREQAVAVRIYQGMEEPPPLPILELPASDATSGGDTTTGDGGTAANEQIRPLVVGGRDEGTATTEASPEPIAEEEADSAVPLKFEGTVRVVLSRYLHLEANLVLRKLMILPLPVVADVSPSPTEQDADPTPQLLSPVQTYYQDFHLVESRRMRSGELHYLDHPLFGLVALITQVPPPLNALPPVEEEVTAVQPELDQPR